MPRLENLNRKQKEAACAAGICAVDNWALVEETEFYMRIIHKTLKKIRRIDRYAIPKKGWKC